jgi:hypothetical protein
LDLGGDVKTTAKTTVKRDVNYGVRERGRRLTMKLAI